MAERKRPITKQKKTAAVSDESASKKSLNLSSIATPSLMLFAATTGSGKTFFMKYVLRGLLKENRFDYAVIICPTACENNDASWYGYVDDKYLINDDIDDALVTRVVTNIITEQKKFIKAGDPKQCVLIIDDIFGCIKLTAPILTRLATSGRHVNITTFLACHRFTADLPLLIRDGAAYVFVFASMTGDIPMQSMRHLYSQVSSRFANWQEFQKFCVENTYNYGVVVINRKSTKKEDAIFLAKAPKNLTKFRIESG